MCGANAGPNGENVIAFTAFHRVPQVTASNTVTLSIDGTLVSKKTVSSTTASFTWHTHDDTKGPHTLSATVKDASGNMGSTSESITLR
jgi:hypothetical protein